MPGDVFDQLPIFKDLSPETRLVVRPLFVPCEGYDQTTLFQQGDPAEHLYLVISGEVVIHYKPEDGPAIIITRVRPGGVVGWSAAIGNRYYTSAAICSGYTQLVRVRGRDLRILCEEDPETGILILERLATVIAERLRNTHDQVITLLKQGLRNQVPEIKEV